MWLASHWFKNQFYHSVIITQQHQRLSNDIYSYCYAITSVVKQIIYDKAEGVEWDLVKKLWLVCFCACCLIYFSSTELKDGKKEDSERDSPTTVNDNIYENDIEISVSGLSLKEVIGFLLKKVT